VQKYLFFCIYQNIVVILCRFWDIMYVNPFQKMKKLLLPILYLVCPILLMGQSAQQADELFNEGQYLSSRAIYEQLVKKSPKNSLYNYRYARCLQETGYHSDAVHYFKLSGDRFILAYYFMGESYLELGMPNEAIESYQAYLNKTTSEDRVERIQQQIKYAQHLERYLKRVRHITIVDTSRVEKKTFLSAYHLTQEAGILSMDSTSGRISYVNQRKDHQVFSSPVGNTMKLVTRYRLMDTWSKPEIMSDEVNFTSYQNYPFMLSDGVTLYFAAQDPNGLGGLDIYMTQYSSSNDSYITPENIGFPFNSKGNDYMYAVDEFTGYGFFASDRFCPEDSVTIYRFLHDKTPRYWVDMPSDSLMAYAKLSLYDMDTVRCSPVVRPMESSAPAQKAEKPIHFVVNDEICYRSLSQFRSIEAKEAFIQCQKNQESLTNLQLEMDDLRQQYVSATSSQQQEIAKQLRQKEQQRDGLMQSINTLSRKALTLEKVAIKQ